ncbi:dnaJ homolog subfamily C member 8-like [Actinia tenebrosa]|uniref:DnaJ homolog subfamily C member 8-like n=1 Tax=Actinia tenebrosa TaxID=6105 RepID=A0A6P8HBU7_ACTTE|nr:dnaJ homolog subfamily C member 8-like [Actinia tenebrosa]
MAAQGETAFSSFMTEVKEIETRDSVLTGPQQIERLTRPGSKYLNLNPYEVLQILPTSSEEDLKKQYKKLSLLVHPDKNREDLERAQKAFDAVSNAYKTTQDPERLQRIKEILDEANAMIVEKIKEKRKEAKIKGQDSIEEDDPLKFRKFHHAVTVKLFADYELKRVAKEAKETELRKRQREEELKEEEATKRKKEWEEQWEESRNERVDSWRNFKSTDKSKKKKDKKSRKEFRPPSLKPEKR